MDDKYAKRIADLLKIAEGGDDAEAQTALEHAERLMARYGIDRAVAMSRGEQHDEQIVQHRIELDGIYSKAYMLGASRVGPTINVKILMVNWPRSKRITLIVTGYQSDVDNFKTLFTSLMLQAVTSANRHAKEDTYFNYFTPAQKFTFRRSHIVGFFDGAADRIQSTRLTVFSETTGSELAVRSRMTAVEEWVDQTYGQLGTTKTRMNISTGYGSGVEAGRQAMTGEPQLKQRGQIGG